MEWKDIKKEKNDRSRFWIILVAILGCVTILSFISFLKSNYRQIRQENMIYIENTAMQTVNRVDDMLLSAEKAIMTLAKLYGNMMDEPEPNLTLLQNIADDALFDYVEYADADGMNWTVDGRSADVSDRDYFQKGMAGETGLDIVFSTRITHETLVVFYTPLYYQDEIVGVLKGEYQEERMSEIMAETYFGEDTLSYLCQSDGTVIAQSGDAAYTSAVAITDIFDETRMTDETQESLLEALQNRESYSFTFEGEAGTTNGYLAPLSQTDWCIVQTFPSTVTAQMIDKVKQAATALLFEITAAFGVYILLIMMSSRRNRKKLETEKTEIARIVDGVNRLFSRFIVVNLDEDTYYYLVDYSEMPSAISRKGSYTDFIKYFSERIIETTGETDLRDALQSEYLWNHLGPDVPFLQYEFHIRRDQADRWENAAIVCLNCRNGAPASVLLAIRDVTEIKQAEDHRREVLTEALQAAKDANNAKSDFLSRMSHDIRTPMNAIMGMTAIASMHTAEPERVKDCLEKIKTAGGHLLTLINEVLDMSKIESGNITLARQPFSLRECVNTVRDMFRLQMQEKGLALKTAEEGLVHDRVSGDLRRLQRILINILGNAVKFTPEGGQISLCVRERECSMVGSACYEFICEDTGVGMDEALLEQIFEPFSRAADSRIEKTTGSGLGLPIARSLARLMNGDILAESTLGKGSRFIVHVVLKTDGEPEPVRVQENVQESEQRFEGKKVLLVEDNELNAEIAAEFLHFFGIEPDFAKNGKEAVDILLSQETCAYDLVFMDIQMPVMNGYEAAKAIRSSGREDLKKLPIIAMTANAFQEDVEKSKAAGMDAHLAKPISHALLAKTLGQWLQ